MNTKGFVFSCDEELLDSIIDVSWVGLLCSGSSNMFELLGPLGRVVISKPIVAVITDNVTSRQYVGSNILDSTDIVSLIKNGGIFSSNRYTVDRNTWFTITFYDEDGNLVNDEIFKDTPNSPDSLMYLMGEFYYNHIDNTTKAWLRGLINDDIANEVISIDLDLTQIDQLVDVMIEDDYLWNVISEATFDIYNDLEVGRYPDIFNPVEIDK